MNLQQVCASVKPYSCVLVTGPQRAGTTIATRILADLLKYRCALEEEFDFHDVRKFVTLLTIPQIVIQAPTMSSLCHLFPDVAVVFMRRNVAEIINSQNRIKWSHGAKEKTKYFYDGPKPIAQVKYEAWVKYQQPAIRERAFELEYNSMRHHPFWVDPEARINFAARQTQ